MSQDTWSFDKKVVDVVPAHWVELGDYVGLLDKSEGGQGMAVEGRVLEITDLTNSIAFRLLDENEDDVFATVDDGDFVEIVICD